jgi:hypothetical protein
MLCLTAGYRRTGGGGIDIDASSFLSVMLPNLDLKRMQLAKFNDGSAIFSQQSNVSTPGRITLR